MARKETFDVCVQHLYDNVEQLTQLPVQFRERIKRLRSGYTLWNDYPNKKPKEILDHITANFAVEKSQAYEDIRLIQEMLGEINKATKDWHRFKFNAIVNRAYEIADLKQDADAMQKAANTYAKFNQLDKEELTAIPWEDIVPQLFVPTEDPTVLGIKPIPNIKQKIAELKKKYAADIEDVTYESIDMEQLERYDRQG